MLSVVGKQDIVTYLELRARIVHEFFGELGIEQSLGDCLPLLYSMKSVKLVCFLNLMAPTESTQQISSTRDPKSSNR